MLLRPMAKNVLTTEKRCSISVSSGWEPTNIANGIAWEFINEGLAGILEKVKKDDGHRRPVAGICLLWRKDLKNRSTDGDNFDRLSDIILDCAGKEYQLYKDLREIVK